MKTAIATTSTAIRINHKAQTIELTKAFAKDAERFGSKSYKELNEARHEFPTYDIAILRQKAKDSHKGLGLDYMKKYIDEHDENGKVKEVFEKCTTTKRGKLALEDGIAFFDLRDWFFVQYPETKDRKALAEQNRIVAINDTLKSKEKIA
ncbi:MAG: hypothetical protein IJ945_01995 [Oscillospiraceae bacterium]|nr:hypothetical protein [Oscillospiraceae bacterium]